MSGNADGRSANSSAPSPQPGPQPGPPLALRMFTLALMCAGCAINGVFISLAVPAMARYGINGMLVAAAIGGVLGIFPARWLANRIHDGLKDEPPTQR